MNRSGVRLPQAAPPTSGLHSELGHDRPGSGQPSLCSRVAADVTSRWLPILSEADMRQTNSNGYNDSRFPFGEAVWISAGIILVLVFGDVLVLLALAAAIVAMTTAW